MLKLEESQHHFNGKGGVDGTKTRVERFDGWTEEEHISQV